MFLSIAFSLILFILQIIFVRFLKRDFSLQKVIIVSVILFGLTIFCLLIFFTNDYTYIFYVILNFYIISYLIFHLINMAQTSSRINIILLIYYGKVSNLRQIKKNYNDKDFLKNRIKRLKKLKWIIEKKNCFYINSNIPFIFIYLFRFLNLLISKK